MGTDRARERCRERVTRLTDSSASADELRFEAIAELQRAIGFEYWCWPLADPETLIVAGALDHNPPGLLAALSRKLAIEESGEDINTKRIAARGARAAVARGAVTGGDLPRSAVWDRCLRPHGVGDDIAAACRDAHGCWGWVIAQGGSDDRPFSDQDAKLLDEVSGTLASLSRSAFVAAPKYAATSDPSPPGVVILDQQLNQMSWTPSARAWLDQMAPNVPASMKMIASRLIANPHDQRRRASAHARIRTTGGVWAMFDAAFLEGHDDCQIAITIRAASADEVLELLCHAHDLTRRETELVRQLVNGLNTQQIAERLYITPYTVKDHLKAIFKKVGVSTRGELVSQLTGRPTSGEHETASAA
jgi:DNA-binding CsgD family transcriptional regulator